MLNLSVGFVSYGLERRIVESCQIPNSPQTPVWGSGPRSETVSSTIAVSLKCLDTR